MSQRRAPNCDKRTRPIHAEVYTGTFETAPYLLTATNDALPAGVGSDEGPPLGKNNPAIQPLISVGLQNARSTRDSCFFVTKGDKPFAAQSDQHLLLRAPIAVSSVCKCRKTPVKSSKYAFAIVGCYRRLCSYCPCRIGQRGFPSSQNRYQSTSRNFWRFELTPSPIQ